MFVGTVLTLCAAGCGTKGPPLAPYVHIPAAVQPITARRSGNDVYVSVTVPSKNVDASVPVSIARVEVFAYTGRSAPLRGRWGELGTLIAVVPIAAAPPDGATSQSAAAPGSIVTVSEALTADKLVQGPTGVPPLAAAKSATPPTDTQPAPMPLRRFYAAFAVNPRGRPGPPGATAELELSSMPNAPGGLTASYTATEMTLSWEPSDGTLGFLLAHTELGPESSPLDEEEERPSNAPENPMARTGPSSYNVYRVRDPDPQAAAPAPPATSKWNAPAPAPINPAPLSLLTATDSVQFDRRVCYTVRAVRGAGARATESVPSEPFCVTPVDTFPPSPPRSLAAVAAGDAIDLIWEASDDADVAGYLVLRGAAGDATLHTLTPAPLREARYRDATVTSGTEYVYAVVAVDGRKPTPNVSAESNRVEETAR